MPSKVEQNALWEYALNDHDQVLALFSQAAKHWRALSLPDDPDDASKYINWSLKQQFFSTMMEYTLKSDTKELRSDGVSQFWHAAADLLKDKG